MNARPAIQFYKGDWKRDPAVQCCSIAARGLWFELLLIMDDAPRRGYLASANGLPMSTDMLARLTGTTPDEASKLLAELEANGVISREQNSSILFNRRMARESELSDSRARAGRIGGSAKTASPTKQTSSKSEANGQATEKQNGGASSSSSSAIAVSSPPLPLPASGEGHGMKPAPQAKPPEPEPDWSAPDPQEIAWQLAAELHSRHPALGSLEMAKAAAIREMAKAAGPEFNPEKFAASVRRTHAAHCEIWQAERAENPRSFVPLLHRWFSEGTYLQTQLRAVPARASPVGKSHLRARLAELEREAQA